MEQNKHCTKLVFAYSIKNILQSFSVQITGKIQSVLLNFIVKHECGKKISIISKYLLYFINFIIIVVFNIYASNACQF